MPRPINPTGIDGYCCATQKNLAKISVILAFVFLIELGAIAVDIGIDIGICGKRTI